MYLLLILFGSGKMHLALSWRCKLNASTVTWYSYCFVMGLPSHGNRLLYHLLFVGEDSPNTRIWQDKSGCNPRISNCFRQVLIRNFQEDSGGKLRTSEPARKALNEFWVNAQKFWPVWCLNTLRNALKWTAIPSIFTIRLLVV